MTCCRYLRSLPQLLGSLLALPLLLLALMVWGAITGLIVSGLIMQLLWQRACNALKRRRARLRWKTQKSSPPTKKHGPELSISLRKWRR